MDECPCVVELIARVQDDRGEEVEEKCAAECLRESFVSRNRLNLLF